MMQNELYKREMTLLAKVERVIDAIPEWIVYSVIAVLAVVTITLTLLEL